MMPLLWLDWNWEWTSFPLIAKAENVRNLGDFSWEFIGILLELSWDSMKFNVLRYLLIDFVWGLTVPFMVEMITIYELGNGDVDYIDQQLLVIFSMHINSWGHLYPISIHSDAALFHSSFPRLSWAFLGARSSVSLSAAIGDTSRFHGWIGPPSWWISGYSIR